MGRLAGTAYFPTALLAPCGLLGMYLEGILPFWNTGSRGYTGTRVMESGIRCLEESLSRGGRGSRGVSDRRSLPRNNGSVILCGEFGFLE